MHACRIAIKRDVLLTEARPGLSLSVTAYFRVRFEVCIALRTSKFFIQIGTAVTKIRSPRETRRSSSSTMRHAALGGTADSDSYFDQLDLERKLRSQRRLGPWSRRQDAMHSTAPFKLGLHEWPAWRWRPGERRLRGAMRPVEVCAVSCGRMR